MWIRCNPNPMHKEVPDCVIRAVSIALHLSWYDVHDRLCALSRAECSVPNDDNVWGKFLFQLGFRPFLLPRKCPKCLSVRRFCELFPRGTYIIGTGTHAVAVINGEYYDSWDSGNAIASFFWKIDE